MVQNKSKTRSPPIATNPLAHPSIHHPPTHPTPDQPIHPPTNQPMVCYNSIAVGTAADALVSVLGFVLGLPFCHDPAPLLGRESRPGESASSTPPARRDRRPFFRRGHRVLMRAAALARSWYRGGSSGARQNRRRARHTETGVVVCHLDVTITKIHF